MPRPTPCASGECMISRVSSGCMYPIEDADPRGKNLGIGMDIGKGIGKTIGNQRRGRCSRQKIEATKDVEPNGERGENQSLCV